MSPFLTYGNNKMDQPLKKKLAIKQSRVKGIET